MTLKHKFSILWSISPNLEIDEIESVRLLNIRAPKDSPNSDGTRGGAGAPNIYYTTYLFKQCKTLYDLKA